MDNLNIGEIGAVIRVNLGYDISDTTPTLILEPEVGYEKHFTDGVTIPIVAFETELESFCAGEYIEYSTKVGDLDYVGRWRKKAKIKVDENNIQQNDFQKFRVLA